MATSAGQKVTKDPEATRKPIQEGTGIITSDSLAAESLKSGGSFADGRAGVSDQPSRGTTTNNTDTSGARTLEPAPDAETRELRHEQNPDAELDAGRPGRRDKSAGIGPTYNVPDSNDDRADNGNAAPAPTVYSADRQLSGGMKPKGRNIQEGGFDEDAPNASFSGDIGGENDPGRVAEQKFQRKVAGAGQGAGEGDQRQTELSGEGQFDALRDEEA